ncbi:MAG: ABC transporter ATP-binding protein [Actinomycetota bacterium]
MRPADPDLVARCRGLCADYRTAAGVAPALREVDADFHRGLFTVVAGPSGSGKSTLLRILAGRLRPTAGAVEVVGVSLSGLHHRARRRLRRRSLGIVLQQPAANLVEGLVLHEQVELAAHLRGTSADDVSDLLASVGLEGCGDLPVGALSGGQQQRAAFAAAAVGSPELLLADEPTAQLDAAAGRDLLQAMLALAERGGSLIVASHDPVLIEAADHRIQLEQGRVVG